MVWDGASVDADRARQTSAERKLHERGAAARSKVGFADGAGSHVRFNQNGRPRPLRFIAFVAEGTPHGLAEHLDGLPRQEKASI